MQLCSGKGENVEMNKEEAAYYYKLSSYGGVFESMHNYSCMLSSRTGVSREDKEAARYI